MFALNVADLALVAHITGYLSLLHTRGETEADPLACMSSTLTIPRWRPSPSTMADGNLYTVRDHERCGRR